MHESDRNSRPYGLLFAVVLYAATAALMIVLAIANRWQINPDGVAYMRIARYWAEGNTDLAVSGYWGPLLSWLMIPFRGLEDGAGDLGAARIAMILSGLLFVAGARSVITRLDLAAPAGVVALVLTALFAARATVETTSPDLLVSALLLFYVASLFGSCWMKRGRPALRAGAIGGAAYLAKAAALPYALALAAVIAGLRVLLGMNTLRSAMRATGLVWAGVLTVALPWIVVLSIHYGSPVFSTSGAINHALIAPDRPPFRHPTYFAYHVPEAGRITKWEDPIASEYSGWSPLSSFGNLRYQISNVYTNVAGVRSIWIRYDAIGIGALCLVASFFFAAPWRESLRTERWRWCFLPAILLVLLYLPVHVGRGRYFYLTYPLAVGAASGAAWWIASQMRNRPLPFGALALASLLFLLPSVRGLSRAWSGERAREGEAAHALALEHVRTGGGPIASVNEQAGLFTAYFADVPWYGSEPDFDADRLQATGADLVVLPGPGANRHVREAFPEVVAPSASGSAVEELRKRGLTVRVIP